MGWGLLGDQLGALLGLPEGLGTAVGVLANKVPHAQSAHPRHNQSSHQWRLAQAAAAAAAAELQAALAIRQHQQEAPRGQAPAVAALPSRDRQQSSTRSMPLEKATT